MTNRLTTRSKIRTARLHRKGFTLAEVLISLGISGLLILGLASTLLLAARASDTTGPTTLALDSGNILHQISTELARTKKILSATGTSIHCVVNDINGDARDDHVRYSLVGTALSRQLNAGPTTTISDVVSHFQIEVAETTYERHFDLTTVSTPGVSVAHETLSSPTTMTLTDGTQVSQFVSPVEFSPALPSTANAWGVPSLSLRLAQSGAVDGTVSVELRAADRNGMPTSLVLAKKTVSESSLPATVDWFEIPFDEWLAELNPGEGVCVVCRHESGLESAFVEYDANAGVGGTASSTNSGAMWDSSTTNRFAFRLTTSHAQATSIELDDKRAQHFQLSLEQAGSPRMSNGGSFPYQPAKPSQFWEVQFNEDPTTIDANGDSLLDWELNTGSISNIGGGVWTATSGKHLQLSTSNDFAADTTVELACRCTQAVGDGAVLYVPADARNGGFVPFWIKLSLNSDGTQSLRLLTEVDGNERLLTRIDDLSDGIQHVMLHIVPDQDIVGISVNNAEVAAFNYAPQTAPAETQRLYLTNDVGTVEFDFVSVSIFGDAP